MAKAGATHLTKNQKQLIQAFEKRYGLKSVRVGRMVKGSVSKLPKQQKRVLAFLRKTSSGIQSMG